MNGLFKESHFNGDISKWDVSNVTDMSGMFESSQFNGDVSKWNVSEATIIEDMFNQSALEQSGNIPYWYKKP